jgi:hypothetical protein
MTIKFKTDNAAFEEDFSGEVVRILQVIIQDVERGYDNGAIMDVNGNKVGTWTY